MIEHTAGKMAPVEPPGSIVAIESQNEYPPVINVCITLGIVYTGYTL